ncbi:MAG: CSLREA domain-containing protein [Candidatus Kerfeldbacteria bacterium]|nr:CSLREA domain-containing protein [Candidatus Kerfeldbacteria bacterium]
MKRTSRKLRHHNLPKGLVGIMSAVALFSLLLTSGIPTVDAAIFVVDITADTVDSSPGDGVCADSAGNCSLRAAIIEANAFAGADVITLPAGTYSLTIAGTGEDATLTGDLDITGDLTINGAGVAVTHIDGGSLDRVLDIQSGATVQVNGVSIQKGDPASNAGGILNQGALTLTKSAVVDNTGLNFGGGIGNLGTLTLIDSTVSHNETNGLNLSGGGGGVFNQGMMTLMGSTFNDNMTLGRGGAIYNLDQTLDVTNSTISGNIALNGGGLFNRFGTIGITHGTVAGNTATDNGGGIWNFGGTLSVANTIVSGNMAATAATNCAGTITSLDYNVDSGTSCAFAGTGDLNSTDPLLGSLTNNSGPTETHALTSGSPAVDAVVLANCSVSTDQRGVPRPMGPACDIGAFERVVPDACNTMIFDTILVGTAGNDLINGANGRDLIFGLGGNDRLNGSNDQDCLVGGDGNDRLNGSNGDDVLDGGSGTDTLNGSNGNDTALGGPGNDVLSGSNGNDLMDGNEGDDRLSGGNGNDTLTGGADTDTLTGGLGIDTCDGETEISCEL